MESQLKKSVPAADQVKATRSGILSQGSSCSVSTATGSSSGGSDCGLSPTSSISMLDASTASSMEGGRTTMRLSDSLRLPSSAQSGCLRSKASSMSAGGSTVEAQSPPTEPSSSADFVSSTSVSSSSPFSDSGSNDGGERDSTLVTAGYGPVRHLPSRKSLPVARIAQLDTTINDLCSAERQAPFTARAERASLVDVKQLSSLARPNGLARPTYNHLENAIVFVGMASRLISSNMVCVDQQPQSVFRAELEDPPIKNGKKFAERLSESMRCKYPCYVLALIYLDHISKRHANTISISVDTFQRLVVAAIVVAAKFYDDLYFSNDHYSKELGFSLETLNTLEVCFLVLLDFNLRVSQQDFKAVFQAFDEVRVECSRRESAPIWCGLNMVQLPADVASIAAAAYRISSPHGSQLQFCRPHPKWPAINHYLVSREVSSNIRFESEEEFLFKASLNGRSKVIQKLIQQHHEELKKLEQETIVNRAAKHKLPLMSNQHYNQVLYQQQRHQYLMLPHGCVMQQRVGATGWER
eukprot:Blabericola_migrator_1__2250@NODE_1620_length_4156_cov_271_473221_g1055_i0_p1_GENE_NODE_1620_length_4156_cov_271_473221_g1055_i0NODE_1620_length_4156_cov_271_473221_g1055_i0_p1_ORF_typecomplete_len526_score69_36Cyclin/PF08613_11/3_4e25Cyclin_N/PF00134_23/1_9e07Cyclin_N/PF00134_23/6_3e03_NODE_1620_length_4156_cov_271_473221_g1055_i016153192